MIQDLTPKELKDYLVDDEVTLVDVPEQWEFDLCQIKGTILIPMNEIAKSYLNLIRIVRYLYIAIVVFVLCM